MRWYWGETCGGGGGPVYDHQVRDLVGEHQLRRHRPAVHPPPGQVSKHRHLWLLVLVDLVKQVGEHGVVAELKPVEGLGAAGEEVAQGAW